MIFFFNESRWCPRRVFQRQAQRPPWLSCSRLFGQQGSVQTMGIQFDNQNNAKRWWSIYITKKYNSSGYDIELCKLKMRLLNECEYVVGADGVGCNVCASRRIQRRGGRRRWVFRARLRRGILDHGAGERQQSNNFHQHGCWLEWAWFVGCTFLYWDDGLCSNIS